MNLVKKSLMDVSSALSLNVPPAAPKNLKAKSGGHLIWAALSHDEPTTRAPKKIKKRTLRGQSKTNVSKPAQADPSEDSEDDPQSALVTRPRFRLRKILQ